MTAPASTPPPSDLFERIKNLLLRSWWGLLLLAAFTIWWQSDKIEKLPFVSTIVDRVSRRKLPAADQLGFSIAVAHLENDTGHGYEKLLLAELEKIKGVKVLPLDRTIRLPEDGAVQDSVEAGHRQAREFLKTSHADALLWGSVLTVSGKEAMQLRWTASAEGPAATGTGRYQAGPDLNLPPLFWSDLDKVIGLIVITRLSFLYESGTYLVDRLRPFISGVRQILANPQANWSGDDRAGLTFALAQALFSLGGQAGDNQALKDSAEQYRQLLAFWNRDSKMLEWAMTQNNLGNTLMLLGERESGTENLHLAVAAYQQALEEYTREKVPLKWAMTQNNLGNALLALAERESRTKNLHLAVAAYQQALEEYTREKVPLDWAMTQNNLGNALLALGERESGTESLRLAVAAYHQALEELTREKVPLDWAMTQNNLGTALLELGKREHSLSRLRDAETALNNALSVFPADYYYRPGAESALKHVQQEIATLQASGSK